MKSIIIHIAKIIPLKLKIFRNKSDNNSNRSGKSMHLNMQKNCASLHFKMASGIETFPFGASGTSPAAETQDSHSVLQLIWHTSQSQNTGNAAVLMSGNYCKVDDEK